MKYYVEVIGDQSVGIAPEYHEVELIFHDSRYEYDIDFYNEIEKAFIQMLKEFYENGTLVNVETEYEKEMREENEKQRELIDAALDEIVNDVNNGDLTAIQELLQYVSIENLMGYLPEE